MYYHYKNLDLLKKVDDSLYYGFVFNNIGNTLLKEKKYSEAKKIINRSLVINKIRQRDYNLATNYTNLATIAYEEDENKLAKTYFEEANYFAQESKSVEKIRDVIQQEALFYKKIGDYKRSLEKQEAFYLIRDSIFNIERAKKVAELESKYETEKKERDLAEVRADLAESELKIKRKNSYIFGSLAFTILLAFVGFLFYRQQKLKNHQLRKEAELKAALVKIETQNKLQEQRLRISRDLHDNIGSQLTFIISSINNLKYRFKDMGDELSGKLSGISGFTTQTIYELRDTIWAMNKNTITWEDLQSRILNFINSANKAEDKVIFNFKVDKGLPLDIVFSSVQGMNIYRIIQEAVNNSLKYANASTISVTVSKWKNSYKVQIEDDGKGFDEATIEKGNGLANIRKRVLDLNGEVNVTSEIDIGTVVLVSFDS